MKNTLWSGFTFLSLLLCVVAHGNEEGIKFVVLPDDAGVVARYRGAALFHYNMTPAFPKPFLAALTGPGGEILTGVGHPVDPEGHRHHRSVWVGHRDVNGHNFWEETEGTRIVAQAPAAGAFHANGFALAHEWQDGAGKRVALERREIVITPEVPGGRYLDLTLELAPGGEGPLVLGKSPFGLLGVRVCVENQVAGGAGRAQNAEGALNEAGTHWKASRWLDYSHRAELGTGPGITVMDHPKNPGYPNVFHVRDDGWVGASITYRSALEVAPGAALVLRYRLYLHGALDSTEAIDMAWKDFAVAEE